jgi:RNA polymerase sigma-70 factor (ECF subfamily)
MTRHEDGAPKPPRTGGRDEFIDLMRAARDGCQTALGRVIERCRPYLLAIANDALDPEIAAKVGASDIVQNSLLSAQRCLEEFQGDSEEELLAWLRGILINDLKQVHRHFRAARRQIGLEQPLVDDSVTKAGSALVDRGDSPSSIAVQREQEECLYRALQKLSPDEQHVVELRNWRRLTFAEIGGQMNRSADAARKLWSRAIVRLQHLLERGDV